MVELEEMQARSAPLTAQDLSLTDKSPDLQLDGLTDLAKEICKTPSALISIIDLGNNRQVFKSHFGLAEPWSKMAETPLSHSFCKHVVAFDEPLIVRNAHNHPLVKDNPAIHELGIVAYLGIPIVDPDGDPIGALCAVDDHIRIWDDQTVRRMKLLAKCVSNEIALRASLKLSQARALELEIQRKKDLRYSALRESVTMAFMAPDLAVEERFRSVLRAGCEAFGMQRASINKFETSQSTIVFAHGDAYDGMEGLRRKISGSLCGRIMQQQTLLCFDDAVASEHNRLVDPTDTVPGSFVGAPLVFDNYLYGAILFSADAPRGATWTEEELSILGIMSTIVASNLTLLGEIERLRCSENALVGYVSELRNRIGEMPVTKIAN